MSHRITDAGTGDESIIRSSLRRATRLKDLVGGTGCTLSSDADSVTIAVDNGGFTATAAEINVAADQSANTEVLTGAGAISVTKRITQLDSTAGTFAATLAAPDATMLGMVKIIEMTVDNGDVTLALTNVQGQSSGTGATFDAVGETLVLVAGTSKWNVIGEAGVTLA